MIETMETLYPIVINDQKASTYKPAFEIAVVQIMHKGITPHNRLFGCEPHQM